MAHIVVLGAGLGGLAGAYELQEAHGKNHKITLINEREYFVFVPSNPWLAVGWRKDKEITVNIKKYTSKKNINFICQRVDEILPEKNQLITSEHQTIDYDYLVIATGPRLAFETIEGSGPLNGYTHSVCTLDHAKTCYENVKTLLNNPGPVVVGAMQGASCFGPAYEYAFILDKYLRDNKVRDKIEITYVSPEPYIGHLGLGGVGDSKGLMESELRNKHIKWITNASVEKIEDGKMYVNEHDKKGEIIDKQELPFNHSMMLPPFAGVDAVAKVEGLCNPKGFVLVDKHQKNPTYENIFSAGVCVAIPPVEVTPVPVGTPKTGFMIESMMAAITENIGLAIEGKQLKAEGSWNAVCLADMGDTGAAFVAIPQIPPRNVTWFKKGKWVHLAKIGFEKYFIHKMKIGSSEPLYEKFIMKQLGIDRLNDQ
ncbi:MAG: sulfide:quinone oxidoreductase [Cognaticolwellia sp.]|jgi:sulfide:quinone oxidoreductase